MLTLFLERKNFITLEWTERVVLIYGVDNHKVLSIRKIVCVFVFLRDNMRVKLSSRHGHGRDVNERSLEGINIPDW
jgi:hypothetical protein